MSLKSTRPPPPPLPPAPVPVPSPRAAPGSPTASSTAPAPASPANPASPPPSLGPMLASPRAGAGAAHAVGLSFPLSHAEGDGAGTPFNTPASRPAAPHLAARLATAAGRSIRPNPPADVPLTHAQAHPRRVLLGGFDAPTPGNTPTSLERLGARLQGSLVVGAASGAGRIAPSYERRFNAGLNDLERRLENAQERAPPSLLAAGAAAHLLPSSLEREREWAARHDAGDDGAVSDGSAEDDLGREGA
ncbi:hypothetical protein Q5752_002783 [Cryptotrichosporon argae]